LEWSRQLRKISTKKEAAKRGNMYERHLERLISRGEGPPSFTSAPAKSGSTMTTSMHG
jgi:hypothetical protein